MVSNGVHRAGVHLGARATMSWPASASRLASPSRKRVESSRDHEAHGSTASTMVPGQLAVDDSCPPCAPTRSARPASPDPGRGAARPLPSSVTRTCRWLSTTSTSRVSGGLSVLDGVGDGLGRDVVGGGLEVRSRWLAVTRRTMGSGVVLTSCERAGTRPSSRQLGLMPWASCRARSRRWPARRRRRRRRQSRRRPVRDGAGPAVAPFPAPRVVAGHRRAGRARDGPFPRSRPAAGAPGCPRPRGAPDGARARSRTSSTRGAARAAMARTSSPAIGARVDRTPMGSRPIVMSTQRVGDSSAAAASTSRARWGAVADDKVGSPRASRSRCCSCSGPRGRAGSRVEHVYRLKRRGGPGRGGSRCGAGVAVPTARGGSPRQAVTAMAMAGLRAGERLAGQVDCGVTVRSPARMNDRVTVATRARSASKRSGRRTATAIRMGRAR